MLSNQTITGREALHWLNRMQVGVGERAESCRIRKSSCSRLVKYSGVELSRRSCAGCLANIVGGAFDCIGLSWGLQWSFVTDGWKHGLWNRAAWLWILFLSFTNYLIFAKLLNFAMPSVFSSVKWGDATYFLDWFCELNEVLHVKLTTDPCTE